MPLILGIDTSNYTTSVALADADSGEILVSIKRLLPVKEGQRGLRQSDAVFHHTKVLPELLREAYSQAEGETVAVAVSVKPTDQPGSYMPCFLAGMNAASAVAAAQGIPLFETTHQTGHILACLYACDSMEKLDGDFFCFHVSGGTTDALLVSPHQENILKMRCVAHSLDLKAGQAVDRIGVKMGLAFPAGKALEALAAKSEKHYSQKAPFKGTDCSLSGLENKALKLLAEGQAKEDVAKFTFDYLANTLQVMSEAVLAAHGNLPLFFAGGVMSNSIIKKQLGEALGGSFCPPAYAADNAAGIAQYGYLQWNHLKN